MSRLLSDTFARSGIMAKFTYEKQFIDRITTMRNISVDHNKKKMKLKKKRRKILFRIWSVFLLIHLKNDVSST